MTEPADHSAAEPAPSQDEVASQIGQAFAALKQSGDAGANWFFWIAGLSLVNTAMAHSGEDRHFIIGLSITAIVDAIAQAIGKEDPEAAQLAMGIAIGFSVCVAAVVILFGWLSRKRILWVFGIGLALYLLDGMAYLALGDFMSAAFHGYALFSMYRGFGAYRQIAQLEAALQAELIPIDAADVDD